MDTTCCVKKRKKGQEKQRKDLVATFWARDEGSRERRAGQSWKYTRDRQTEATRDKGKERVRGSETEIWSDSEVERQRG